MNQLTWELIIVLTSAICCLLAVLEISIKSLYQLKKTEKTLLELNNLSEFNDHDKIEYISNLNEILSTKHNIKKPILKFYIDQDPNASAYKLFKNNYIVFTQNVLMDLNQEALGAILAHELNHIKDSHYHKNTIRSILCSFLWMIFWSLSVIYLYLDQSMTASEANASQFIANSLLISLYFSFIYLTQWIFILMVSSFFSRKEEIDCDIFAIKNTSSQDFFTQAMFFYNLNKDFYVNQKIWDQLFNSHPSWETRLNLLNKF